MPTQKRIPVAVLGATGMVGQRFIELLHGHPWFELVALAASDQHEGRSYAQVAQWRLSGSEMPTLCCFATRSVLLSRSATP